MAQRQELQSGPKDLTVVQPHRAEIVTTNPNFNHLENIRLATLAMYKDKNAPRLQVGNKKVLIPHPTMSNVQYELSLKKGANLAEVTAQTNNSGRREPKKNQISLDKEKKREVLEAVYKGLLIQALNNVAAGVEETKQHKNARLKVKKALQENGVDLPEIVSVHYKEVFEAGDFRFETDNAEDPHSIIAREVSRYGNYIQVSGPEEIGIGIYGIGAEKNSVPGITRKMNVPIGIFLPYSSLTQDDYINSQKKQHLLTVAEVILSDNAREKIKHATDKYPEEAATMQKTRLALANAIAATI